MPASAGTNHYLERKSTTHGRGVFASTEIPRGTRNIEYKGKRTTKLLNSQNDRLGNSQSSLSSHHGVGAITIAL